MDGLRSTDGTTAENPARINLGMEKLVSSHTTESPTTMSAVTETTQTPVISDDVYDDLETWVSIIHDNKPINLSIYNILYWIINNEILNNINWTHTIIMIICPCCQGMILICRYNRCPRTAVLLFLFFIHFKLELLKRCQKHITKLYSIFEKYTSP